ncbi:nucleotide sugar dehydrogenase [Lentisphaerota bacterium WC36G]|nr:nucleotide sugar dehydrogenase [Lentisphaerae bacterium WC36]
MVENQIKTILCIGAGYVGTPTMAVIADNCPEYKIIVVDKNIDKIRAWNSDSLPIYEPGLEDIIKRRRNKNLFFSEDIATSIKEASIIFVSVNTPTKKFGLGAGMASDLQFIELVARDIIKYAQEDKLVIEKSTLPVKTAEALSRVLHSNDKGLKFEVLSNPEFLAEGTAINDLQHPDRVLIGSMKTESGIESAKILRNIYTHWVPTEKIKLTNLWSSELSKLVANAMLAQRVSSINSISALCEKTNADVEEVSHAVGMDSRIGSKFLNTSVGFGGSCFKKDILNLVYICRYYGLNEVADYWEQVVIINEYQQNRFVNKVIDKMFNTVVDKKIAVLGFAFKANTGDTRESPAITVTKMLLKERADVAIYDPKAIENAKLDLADYSQSNNLHFYNNAEDAIKDSHAILVLTAWDEFKELDFEEAYRTMKKPSFIFDGCNILQHEQLKNLGFNVNCIGKNLDRLKDDE